jgi:hypothetical protein
MLLSKNPIGLFMRTECGFTQVAPSKTIVGQAEKIEVSPGACGSVMIIGRDIFGCILINKKHLYLTACTFSFKILKQFF